MYFHVIENTMRDGIKGYRLVKTYQKPDALLKYLLRTGAPVWIVESQRNFIPYTSKFGGFTASYWNTGGFGITTMPVMPMFPK